MFHETCLIFFSVLLKNVIRRFLPIYFILDQPDADAVQSQQKSEVLNGFSFDFFSFHSQWKSNTESLSFILSGELHDIFVGLMGRRNSESGECLYVCVGGGGV